MNGHNAAQRQPSMNSGRYDELKAILEERRREIMSEVQGRMRDVRSEGAGDPGQGVLDAAESSELDIQDEIEFALIQMNIAREMSRRLRITDDLLFRAQMGEVPQAPERL